MRISDWSSDVCSSDLLDRRRAALMFAVIDRLDIVAVGVEQERGVIARMIGPLARRAIVAAARRQPGLVKGIDRRAIRRLKRQVMPPGQLAQRRFAVLGDRKSTRLNSSH